jgi:hypothetical protein
VTLSSAVIRIRNLITKSLAKQHFNYCSIAPHHAQGIFKLEVNRRWGLTAAKEWARLLHDCFYILVLGFDDETGLGAQVRQRHFYYSRNVRNGHGNGHRQCPRLRGGNKC